MGTAETVNNIYFDNVSRFKEIRISLERHTALALAEVQLFGQIFGGTASQSSGYLASHAIDGDYGTYNGIDGDYGTRSNTRYELNPWWKYVLDREQIVGSI